MKKYYFCFDYLSSILKFNTRIFVGITIMFVVLINSKCGYTIPLNSWHAVPTLSSWSNPYINRNVSLVSDGTNLYYTSGGPRSYLSKGPYFYSIPGGSVFGEEWTTLNRMPELIIGDNDGGPDGLGYSEGYIYGSSCTESILRNIIRYDIAGNIWNVSGISGDNSSGQPASAGGANAASVVDDIGNIFGFWKGDNKIEKVTNWWNMTEEWQSGIDVGATHSVDSTRDGNWLYFLRQRDGAMAAIYRIPADGTATSADINLFITASFNVGLGCAIEHVSSDISHSGDDELWVLAGNGDGTGEGQGGTPRNLLGICQLGTTNWTEYELPFNYGEGADMCLVGTNMYFIQFSPNNFTNALHYISIKEFSRSSSTNTHYVSLNGGHVAPYMNWATAATNIQAAIDVANAGTRVVVSNGVYANGSHTTPGYSTKCRVVLDKEILLESFAGAEATVILGNGPCGANAVRGAYVGSAAILSGFTLSNGHAQMTSDAIYDQCGGGAIVFGTVSNCVIVECSATNGGGAILFSGGKLIGSVIENNTSERFGGGVWCYNGGTVSRSHIIGNDSYYGGGIALEQVGIFENSVCMENHSIRGAVYCTGAGAFVRNCTIINNVSKYSPGGLRVWSIGGVENSIIMHNIPNNHYVYNTPFINSCVSPYPVDIVGCITNDPKFVGANDYHLLSVSPCINTGDNNNSNGLDIDGELRIGNETVDIGADEAYSTGEIIVSIDVDNTVGVRTATHTFIADICGQASQFEWRISGDSGEEILTNVISHQYSWQTVGSHLVILHAYNETHSVSATATIHTVSGFTNYVSQLSTTPVSPYITWATAATNIQDAVDSVASKGLVIVSNGFYNAPGRPAFGLALTNVVTITRGITVESLNGPETTVISGFEPEGRCVYVSDQGRLCGFTLSNGWNESYEYGGGAIAINGSEISNCAIRQCASSGVALFQAALLVDSKIIGCSNTWGNGGGVYATENSFIKRSDIINCYGYYGGGIYAKEGVQISECTIVECEGWYGGGIYTYENVQIYDSSITKCNSLSDGGGLYLSWSVEGVEAVNLLISSNNSARYYGGIYACNSKIYNCRITDNISTNQPRNYVGGGCFEDCNVQGCYIARNISGNVGGGCFENSSVRDCLIEQNVSAYDGGGCSVWRSLLENCTIVNNSALTGGGICDYGYSTQRNTIVYYNFAQTGTNWHDCETWEYSCTKPVPGGAGNFSTVPQFIDMTDGDFRLYPLSPCINAGTNISWMSGSLDFGGTNRLLQGKVDVGAYESFYGVDHPLIVITDITDEVTYDTTTIDIAGTNNLHVTGEMVWSNHIMQISGTFLATPGWEIVGLPVTNIGINKITISGSNSAGIVYTAIARTYPRRRAKLTSDPAAVFLSAEEGKTDYKNLQLTNIGDTNAHAYLSLEPKFWYSWKDSSASNGPDYAWIDISTQGAYVADYPIWITDGITPELPLGFSFPFYGTNFTKIYISTYGVLSFASGEISKYKREFPARYGLPGPAIAPLWTDFEISKHVFWYSDGDRFIVTWDKMTSQSLGGNYSFQIILHKTGEVVFQYKEADGSEDGNTSIGMQLTNDINFASQISYQGTNYIKANFAVKITPIGVQRWLSAAPSFLDIPIGTSNQTTVTGNAMFLTAGVYFATLEAQQEGYSTPMVTIPVEFNVTHGPGIEITTTICQVDLSIDTYSISGTNSPSSSMSMITGEMWLTNFANGEVYKFAAAESWAVSPTNFNIGQNLIMVCGTNTEGVIYSDSILIYRIPEGYEFPTIDITNSHRVYTNSYPFVDFSGQCNQHAVGNIYMTNSANQVVQSCSAQDSWIINNLQITTGFNQVYAYAANYSGDTAIDTCSVDYINFIPNHVNPAIKLINYGTEVYLSWPEPSEEDISHYLIFKSSVEFTNITGLNDNRLIHQTSSRNFSEQENWPYHRLYFAVVAVDYCGAFHHDVEVVSILPGDITPPPVPYNIWFICGKSNLVMKWNAPEYLFDLAGYNIYCDSVLVGTNLPPTATSFDINVINPPAGYDLQISTFDENKNANYTPLIPGATLLDNPLNITVDPFHSELDVSWSGVAPSEYVKEYAVYCSTVPFNSCSGMVPRSVVTTSNATITNLVNNQTYFVAVATINVCDGIDYNVTNICSIPRIDFQGPVISNLCYNNISVENGFTNNYPGKISIEAYDRQRVNRVEFYVNGEQFGCDTDGGPEFSRTWDIRELSDGVYSLEIRAYDSLENLSSITNEVIILLSPPPHSPNIIMPLEGSLLIDENIEVSGTGDLYSDAIRLFTNGVVFEQSIPMIIPGTFSKLVTLGEGVSVIEAASVNRAGESPRASVTVTVDTSLPVPPVGITGKAKPSGVVKITWWHSSKVRISGYNIYSSELPITNKNEATKLTTEPILQNQYEDLPLSNGVHYYRLTTVNTVGIESELSAQVSVISDDASPFASITLSSTGNVISNRFGPGTVSISVETSEELISAPFVSISRSSASPLPLEVFRISDTSYTGQFIISSDMGVGQAFVMFAGSDLVGNSGTEIISGEQFEIDTLGPVAGISVIPDSPIRNFTTNPVTVTANISFDSSDPSISTPDLSYYLSATQTNRVPLSIVPNGPNAWSASFSLPAIAGNPNEMLMFVYDGVDELGNHSEHLTGDVENQVYQGNLPPLPPPSFLRGLPLPAGQIYLWWEEVSNASDYLVYRSNPGESSLEPIALTVGKTNYIDSALEGTNFYSVATLCFANNQIGTGAYCSAIALFADATLPVSPTDLWLDLKPQGIQLGWQSGEPEDQVSYNVYRDTVSINSVTGLTPIISNVLTTNAIDRMPLLGPVYYVISSKDIAGNISSPSASVSTNIALLPVTEFSVNMFAGQLPVLNWMHIYSNNISGYNVYVGEPDSEIKMNAELLTANSFSFIVQGWSATNCRYSISAVHLSGQTESESIRRSVVLPMCYAAIVTNQEIKRSLINLIEYKVNNNSGIEFTQAVLEIKLNNHRHISTPFNIGGNAEVIVPVVIPGYTNLSDVVTLSNRLLIVSQSEERTILDSVSIISVIDDLLQLNILNQPFIRGVVCTAQVSIINNSDVQIEAITAINNGKIPSTELRIKLLDIDDNVIAVTPLQQVLGSSVITLPNKTTVLRIQPGDEFLSAPIAISVPASAPDNVRLRFELDSVHYNYGSEGHVAMPGTATSRMLSLNPPAYIAVVTNISPLESMGFEPITISGKIIEPSSGSFLSHVPLKLAIAIDGFERSFTVYSDSLGNWTYNFDVPNEEEGLFRVYAAHPSVTDRTEQGQFSINRITISPSKLSLVSPRNYNSSVEVNVKICNGLTLTNLQFDYVAEDQVGGVFLEGISVECGSAVSIANAGQNCKIGAVIRADANAPITPFIVLRVKSDGPNPGLWGKVTVQCSFLDGDAAPLIVATPSFIETGVAISNSVTEEIILENLGFLPMENVTISLVDKNGNDVPYWVILNTSTNLGTLGINDSKALSICFSPGEDVSVSISNPYEFYIKVAAKDFPASSIPVYVYVDNSGKGNALFHIVDIYTDTLDQNSNIIKGVKGATVKLIKEIGSLFITNLISDVNGEVSFQELPVGMYTVRVSAPNHNDFGDHIWIKPAITLAKEYPLPNDLISFEWSVDEITLLDIYNIILNIIYETDVPAAVLILDPPSAIIPDMEVGDVFRGEITLKNYGLIQAEDLDIEYPTQNAYYKYEFLGDVPETIKAREEVKIPYRIICLKKQGESKKTGGDDDCIICNECIELYYDYVCENGYRYSGVSYSCFVKITGDCFSEDGEGEGGGVSESNNFGTTEWLLRNGINADGVLTESQKCWIENQRQEVVFKSCHSLEPQKNILEIVGCLVDTQRGEYRDDMVDLPVKAPGRIIKVIRRYYDDKWHWDNIDAGLVFTSFLGGMASNKQGDSETTTIAAEGYISKGGIKYILAYQFGDEAVYINGNYKIVKTDGGYQWTSPNGDWENYDDFGKILNSGNNLLTLEHYLYDGNNVSGIADIYTNQVIWVDYNTDDKIYAVRDYKNHKVEYKYDEDGKLTNVIDTIGRNFSYQYDGSGKIIKAIDPEGKWVDIFYGEYNRVKSVIDQDGIGKFFVYDYNKNTHEWYVRTRHSSGQIKEVWFDRIGETRRVDIDGETVQTITKDENRFYVTDHAGRTIRKDVDENGYVKRIIFHDGTSVSYKYHPVLKQLTRFVNQLGVVTEFEYNDEGWAIHRIDAKGLPEERHSRTVCDDLGRVTSLVIYDKNHNYVMTNHFAYDYFGNLTNHIDGEGHVTSASEFDSVGNLVSLINPDGQLWNFAYDDAFRATATTNPLGTVTRVYSDDVNNVTAMFYNSQLQMATQVDRENKIVKKETAFGMTSTVEFDEKGRPVKSSFGDYSSLITQYDKNNRVVSLTDKLGYSKNYSYDSLDSVGPNQIEGMDSKTFVEYDIMGRVVKQIYCSFGITNFTKNISYNLVGHPIEIIFDGSETNKIEYDGIGRIIKTVDWDGLVVTRSYDCQDNIISITDQDGTINLSYDKCNNLTNIIYADGKSMAVGYTPMRRIAWKIDSKGRKVDYEYDGLGRLVALDIYNSYDHISPEKSIEYTYNNHHKVVSCFDGTVTISNVFDKYQRKLAEIVDYGTFSLAYSNTYNNNGMRSSFTAADGLKIGYSYDQFGRLQSIGIPGAGVMTVGDYQMELAGSVTMPGGIKRSCLRDSRKQLTNITDLNSDDDVLLNHIYNYDEDNLIIKKETEHGIYNYMYDDEFRLVTATNANGITESYAYDSQGNRTNSAETTNPWVYDYENRLISNEVSRFEYDEYGNVTMVVDAASVRFMKYDVLGHMIQVADGNGVVIATYNYDILGRRLSKFANNVTSYYQYSHQGLVGEYNAQGQITKSYGFLPYSRWSTRPIFMKVDDEFFWFRNDKMGTPQKLVDSEGVTVWEGRYDSFGNCSIICNNVKSNLRLPGQYFDEETGLFYNWNRYYNPKLGRYMTKDPIRQGLNHYLYVGANPIMLCDPTGLHSLEDPVNTLEFLGLFDPTPVCDGACAIIYLTRGEYGQAALSTIAIVPVFGDVIGKGGKLAIRGVAKYGDEVVAVASQVIKHNDSMAAVAALGIKYSDNLKTVLTPGEFITGADVLIIAGHGGNKKQMLSFMDLNINRIIAVDPNPIANLLYDVPFYNKIETITDTIGNSLEGILKTCKPDDIVRIVTPQPKWELSRMKVENLIITDFEIGVPMFSNLNLSEEAWEIAEIFRKNYYLVGDFIHYSDYDNLQGFNRWTIVPAIP